MITDYTPEVKLFQPLGVKTSEQHVVDKKQIDLTGLEVFYPVFALLFATHVVQNQCTTSFTLFSGFACVDWLA